MKTISGGLGGIWASQKNFERRKILKITSKQMEKKETIPIFFAADDGYLPFLDVAVTSLQEHINPQFDYVIYVLHAGISSRLAEKVMRHSRGGFSIRFVDVSDRLAEIVTCLQLRDYYTSAIYYRLFIVGMFPEYDKAIYLDCDTVILGDISELYCTDLQGKLIGGVADLVVASVPTFGEYTQKALGVAKESYFNSGVLVMNLQGLRNENFTADFFALLRRYDFRVAPDQDCLNVLCREKVHYFSREWNEMPQAQGECLQAPKIIHYNLAQKPWYYEGIRYEEYFWKYAQQSAFYADILAKKKGFTQEMRLRDEEGGRALLALAQGEIERIEKCRCDVEE